MRGKGRITNPVPPFIYPRAETRFDYVETTPRLQGERSQSFPKTLTYSFQKN